MVKGTSPTAMVAIGVLAVLLGTSCFAQDDSEATILMQEETLMRFLQDYVGASEEALVIGVFERGLEESEDEASREIGEILLKSAHTGYFDAYVDLNGDLDREIVIQLTGSQWCGSGGCTMLVLTPDEGTYRVVGRTTITRPPVRVLNSRTNGWRDLSVIVSGGGIDSPFEARLRFDGEAYPRSPMLGDRLTDETAGEILLMPRPAAESKRVFVP